MPPEIPGVGATPRLLPSAPIGPAVPSGPAAPVAPSTAVVPVGTVGPRGQSAASLPLGRSGLDLLDVIGTTDVLVERHRVAPVALDVGLETARGALLRGLAAESLATLDAVWERAQLTEEGWYLRSGALTVLGLPGEAERVSTEALQRKPASVALRFMQSLARLASGDVGGARGALAAVGEQHTTHPVLLMQQIVVLARQGHRAEAERLLQQVLRVFPEHPAVEFARASLRTISADQARSTSRSAFGGSLDEPSPFTTGDHDVFEAFGAPAGRAFTGHREVSAADVADIADVEVDLHTDSLAEPPADRDAGLARTGNVAERALARLGARFSTLSMNDAVREGRMLIRAFSAGGSMSGACAPEQAHAARLVLSSLVMYLNGGTPTPRAGEGSAPLDVLLAQWMPLMQDARFDDAARVIRRLGASIPDAQRRLLAACSQASWEPSPRDARDPLTRSFGTGDYEAIVQGDTDKGPLIPVRLGLALLEARAADRSHELFHAASRATSGDIDRVVWSRTQTPGRLPGVLSVGSRETDGRGWGAAMAASSLQPPPRDEGTGVRVAALLCVVVAAGAAMTGNGVIAIALGFGAAWLGWRRRGRSDGRPNESPDGRPTGRQTGSPTGAGGRDATGAD